MRGQPSNLIAHRLVAQAQARDRVRPADIAQALRDVARDPNTPADERLYLVEHAAEITSLAARINPLVGGVSRELARLFRGGEAL